MELFELKYFVAVAKNENIHRASENLRVSPASLSKAISRLEKELGVLLFSREGRVIRLTDHGRLLRFRATQILQFEESAKMEIAGKLGDLQVVLAGPEVLLSKFGIELAETLQRKFKIENLSFQSCSEDHAIKEVSLSNAHLAIVTTEVPSRLTSKVIGEVRFQVVVGQKHPLYAKKAWKKEPISIEELLTHSFVSPSLPLLGRVGLKQSLDGWRDDEFPRRVKYLTSSLKLLEALVLQGRAVAYLPDYFAESLGLEVLTVTGCSHSCTQKVSLVSYRPEDVGWLNQLF